MGINQRGLARQNWDFAISNGGIEEWFTGPTISNYHMIWACLKIKDVPKNGDFEGTIKLLEDPSSSQRVAIPPPPLRVLLSVYSLDSLRSLRRAMVAIANGTLKSYRRLVASWGWQHMATTGISPIRAVVQQHIWTSAMINKYIYIYLCTYIHYITLDHITLHYMTWHFITLHYVTLHYTTLHYITLHYVTLRCVALHYITYVHHYITLH